MPLREQVKRWKYLCPKRKSSCTKSSFWREEWIKRPKWFPIRLSIRGRFYDWFDWFPSPDFGVGVSVLWLPSGNQRTVPRLLCLPFLTFYVSSHDKGDDSYADAGLKTEKQAFDLPGKFSSEGCFKDWCEPGFIFTSLNFGNDFSAFIVGSSEFGSFEGKQRNDGNESDNY